MSILDKLESLKNGDSKIYRGYEYFGEYPSIQEAQEQLLAKNQTGKNKVLFWSNEDGYDNHYVFSNAGIKQFIQDFGLSDSFTQYFKNNTLGLSRINSEDSDILLEIEGSDISKYLNYDKTAKNFLKDYDIIKLDDDYFMYSNYDGQMDLGNIYMLSRDTINDDLQKYPELARRFSSVQKDGINLHSLDDNVGDKLDIYERIDLYHRELPFIYLNGKVTIANENCTHTQLLNSLYDTNLLNSEQIVNVNNINDRINTDVISFGTGQIIDGVAIIDLMTCENCSAEEITDELKKYVEKVYTTDDRHEITRVAKVGI